MIIVVTTKEYNRKLRRHEILISHGYNAYTGEIVIMPCEPIDQVDYVVWDSEVGEYVVKH